MLKRGVLISHGCRKSGRPFEEQKTQGTYESHFVGDILDAIAAVLQVLRRRRGHAFWSNWEMRSIQSRAFAPVEKSKIE